ncbi:putative eukaryotic LigT [Actinidia rufa]|uniref:Putative eukaryotic LigT n=1 Tax=Actinidia rufa TaxID=165716 RepID=A0A7J0FF52_9ERIC|nr:putative eukaryotic LigT [Actinidia rufa]
MCLGNALLAQGFCMANWDVLPKASMFKRANGLLKCGRCHRHAGGLCGTTLGMLTLAYCLAMSWACVKHVFLLVDHALFGHNARDPEVLLKLIDADVRLKGYLHESAECLVEKLQVESEDLHEVDDAGKQKDGSQVQAVRYNISGSAADTLYAHEEVEASSRAPEGGSVSSDEKHSISVEVGASLMRFIKGKGGSTQEKIEEEMGVKIIFPSSKKEDAIIIEGVSAESVNRASERVQVIIDEAVKSPNLDYSHFISLPLALHPELVDKLVNFQKSTLGIGDPNEGENLDSDSNGDTSEDEDKDQELDRIPDVAVKLNVEDDKHVKVDIANIHRVSYLPKVSKPSELRASKPSALSGLGIERSIFIKPKTFHLTVLMLKLWNKDRVDAAAEVLQSVSSKVVEALESRPVSVRLKGLECMRGPLAKARVLYAPVEEIGSDGRLLRACTFLEVITDAFVEAGLVLEKDAQQKLKLHATVMNARHRKRCYVSLHYMLSFFPIGLISQTKWTRKLDSFDARGIIKQFGSEEWGEYPIREAHLSQRFVYDQNGYYRCCASIPFPVSMQLD